MAGLPETYRTASSVGFTMLEPGSFGEAIEARPAPTDNVAVEFTIVRTPSGMAALETEWNALFERAGKPHQVFQTFNWNWHWCQSFTGHSKAVKQSSPIAILVGRQGTRIVTIWPLVIERHGALTELSWMGEPVSQYGDVLLDGSVAPALAVLQAGWIHLVKTLKPDLARLRKVRADAAIAPLLNSLGTLQTAELEAPFIDLTRYASYAAYEAQISSHAKRNRRRYMRRLEQTGKITIKHLDESPEAAALAGTAIELKRRWLLDTGKVSLALADQRMAQFMTGVAGNSDRSTATRVSALLSSDQPAAIQIGFTCEKTRFLHVIVYDRSFEKTAAGVLHMEQAVRHGFDEGLERIDFMAPAAPYKLEWANGSVAVVDHALGLSWRGRAYARGYLGFLRNRLKAALERMPPSVRRFISAAHLNQAA